MNKKEWWWSQVLSFWVVGLYQLLKVSKGEWDVLLERKNLEQNWNVIWGEIWDEKYFRESTDETTYFSWEKTQTNVHFLFFLLLFFLRKNHQGFRRGSECNQWTETSRSLRIDHYYPWHALPRKFKVLKTFLLLKNLWKWFLTQLKSSNYFGSLRNQLFDARHHFLQWYYEEQFIFFWYEFTIGV